MSKADSAPPDMESYEVVEVMRSLSEGDTIRVWYTGSSRRFPGQAESVLVEVTDTSSGRKPLIDCRPVGDVDLDVEVDVEVNEDDLRYHLEAAGRRQAGYKLRNIAGITDGPSDGSVVTAVETDV